MAREKFFCVKKINKMLSIKKDDDPTVKVSAGVAFGEPDITVDIIFKRADTCLYEVKNGNMNEISFYKSAKADKKKKTNNKQEAEKQ